jgi:hypothetical protein
VRPCGCLYRRAWSWVISLWEGEHERRQKIVCVGSGLYTLSSFPRLDHAWAGRDMRLPLSRFQSATFYALRSLVSVIKPSRRMSQRAEDGKNCFTVCLFFGKDSIAAVLVVFGKTSFQKNGSKMRSSRAWPLCFIDVAPYA